MRHIGLVFDGGGGKGAYQIGVWRYLRECGLDQNILAVSGTSVGALNAALFVGSSYDKAVQVWSRIRPGDILSLRRWEENREANENGGLFGALFESLKESYAFERRGLKRIIQHSLNFAQLCHSSIPCYATCVEVPSMKVKRFCLNNYSNPESVIQVLLASSAIPMAFPSQPHHGRSYYDGGIPWVGDNAPIEPLYENENIDTILVVHLNQQPCLDPNKFPGVNLIEMMPSKSLGNLLDGTLNFTSGALRSHMDLGYWDAVDYCIREKIANRKVKI